MTRVDSLDVRDSAGARRWDDFVSRCERATFFHRSGWQPVIRDVFGHSTHFLQAIEGDRVVGVLPLAHVRSRLFGNALVGLPFATYGGIAAETADASRVLQEEAVRLAEVLQVGHLELRNVERQQDWPVQELYVDFRMPVPAVLDDRMAAIPQKRRNLVRKALKLGMTAVRGDSVAHFFPTFAENARDHGTPTLPRRYFERLAEVFGDDCSILSICDATGRRVSSIMCFFHRQEVLAYYAGETRHARSTSANDLKYWEVMRWAKDRGCTVFDIGRSKKDTGSYEFKRLWGFEPVQLHYQYHLVRRTSIPQHNPNNPRYRRLIRTWQRLPLPIANCVGPWIVRSLG